MPPDLGERQVGLYRTADIPVRRFDERTRMSVVRLGSFLNAKRLTADVERQPSCRFGG